MKYSLKITAVLVLLFLASQVVGLLLVNESISSVEVTETGERVIEHKETPVQRPETAGFESFLFILLGVGIATGVILFIVKMNWTKLWKLWFFMAVWITMTISLAVFLENIPAAVLAFALGAFKLLRPNPVLHNITEILIYSGIVVLFAPVFDIFWVLLLLLAISVYDGIAVWKTGHMVRMAEFLGESKAFAGISYPLSKFTRKKRKSGRKSAILGGGDIAFPLLFSGVVMEQLIKNGLGKITALGYTLIITGTVTVTLLILLALAEKDRFYPAMPFLTAGCLAGYGLISLVLGVF